MLERILATILVLGSVTGCYATTKTETEVKRDIDLFYSKREILEERTGKDFKEKKVKYQYKNGIEAEVNYKKDDSGLADIYIKILSDPNNVLVRNIPASKTPSSSSYQLMFFEDGSVKKAIGFRFNLSNVRILFKGSKFDYVKVEDADFFVLPPLDKKGESKLAEIENDLNLEEHIETLKNM